MNTTSAGFVLPIEVARLFGVSRRTVYEWVRKGVFGDVMFTPAGHARLTVEQVQALLDRSKEGGQQHTV